jgi:hypothetical protein
LLGFCKFYGDQQFVERPVERKEQRAKGGQTRATPALAGRLDATRAPSTMPHPKPKVNVNTWRE